jgi:hypothetical protein
MALTEMTTAVFPKTPPGGRIFRSGATRFAGWAWIVFAALNLADLAWRGRDKASLVAAAVLILGCGIAYAVALRPRIIADEKAVHFHNLLRDVHLPWDAIERLEGGDAIYAHTKDTRFRAFVLQTSPRARAKAELRATREDKNLPEAVADYMKGRTATDFTVEIIREMSEKNRNPGEQQQTWSIPAILSLAAPVTLFSITLAIALI